MEILDYLTQPMFWIASTVLTVISTIAVNIVSNILTPHTTEWWAKRSAISKKKTLQQLERELRALNIYARSPHELYLYLLTRTAALVVQCAFIAFYVSMLIPLFVTYLSLELQAQPQPIAGRYTSVSTYIAPVCFFGVLCGLVLLMRNRSLFDELMETVRAVRHYDEYKRDIDNRIEELKKSSNSSPVEE